MYKNMNETNWQQSLIWSWKHVVWKTLIFKTRSYWIQISFFSLHWSENKNVSHYRLNSFFPHFLGNPTTQSKYFTFTLVKTSFNKKFILTVERWMESKQCEDDFEVRIISFLWLYLYLSLSLSLSLYLCLVSLSLSVSISLCLSNSLSLSISVEVATNRQK